MAYGPPQSAHTTQTGVYASSGGNTWGARFVLAAAGDIVSLRYLRPIESTTTTARTLRLWNDNATPVQLASATTTGESGSGWRDAVLSPPYTVTPGQVVRVSLDNPDNMIMTSQASAAVPITNGDVSLTTFYRNAPVTGPPITVRTTDPFVDLVFRTGTPAVGGRPKVHNGTDWTAVPARVYDGGTWTEVPLKAHDGTTWEPVT